VRECQGRGFLFLLAHGARSFSTFSSIHPPRITSRPHPAGVDALTRAALTDGYAVCYAAAGVSRDQEGTLSLVGEVGDDGGELRAAVWQAVQDAAAVRAASAGPGPPPWPGAGVAWGEPLPAHVQPPPTKHARTTAATPGLYRRSLVASLLSSRPPPAEAVATIVGAYAARHPAGRGGGGSAEATVATARAAAWGAHLCEALSEGLEAVRAASAAGRRRAGGAAADDAVPVASTNWLYLTHLAGACGSAGLLPPGCLAGWVGGALAGPDPSGVVGAAVLPLATAVVCEAPREAGGGVAGLGLSSAGSLLACLAARGGSGSGPRPPPPQPPPNPLAPAYAALASRLAALLPAALVVEGDRLGPSFLSCPAAAAARRAVRGLAAAAQPPGLALLDAGVAASILAAACAKGDVHAALGALVAAVDRRSAAARDDGGSGRLPSRAVGAAVGAALDWATAAASAAPPAASSSIRLPFTARLLAAGVGGDRELGARTLAAWVVEQWQGADPGAPGVVAVAAVVAGSACPATLVRCLGRVAAAGGPTCPAAALITALHPSCPGIQGSPTARGFAAARRAALRAAGEVEEGEEAAASARKSPGHAAADAAALAASLESADLAGASAPVSILKGVAALDALGASAQAAAACARLAARAAAAGGGSPSDPAALATALASLLGRAAPLLAAGSLVPALDALTAGSPPSSPSSHPLLLGAAAALLERCAGTEQAAAWLTAAAARPGWAGLETLLRRAADPAATGRALLEATRGGDTFTSVRLAASLVGDAAHAPPVSASLEAGLVAAAWAIGPDDGGGAQLALAAVCGLADPLRCARALMARAAGDGLPPSAAWPWLPWLVGGARPAPPGEVGTNLDALVRGAPWPALWGVVGPALAAAAAGGGGGSTAAAAAGLSTHAPLVAALLADPAALGAALAALPLPAEAGGGGTLAGRIAAALATGEAVRPVRSAEATPGEGLAAAVAARGLLPPPPLLHALVEELAVRTGAPGVPPAVAVSVVRAALARPGGGGAGGSAPSSSFLPSAARRLASLMVARAAGAPNAACGAAIARTAWEMGPAVGGAVLEGLAGVAEAAAAGWPAALLVCLAASAPAPRAAAAAALIRRLDEGGGAAAAAAVLPVLAPLLPFIHATPALREAAAAALVGCALATPGVAERAAFFLAALARSPGPPGWAGGGGLAGVAPLACGPALAARVNASAAAGQSTPPRLAARLLAALGASGAAAPAAATTAARAWHRPPPSADPAACPPPWLVELGAIPLPHRPPAYGREAF